MPKFTRGNTKRRTRGYCRLNLKDWVHNMRRLTQVELAVYLAWFTLHHAAGGDEYRATPVGDVAHLLSMYRNTVNQILATLQKYKLVTVTDKGILPDRKRAKADVMSPHRCGGVMMGVKFPVSWVAFRLDDWLRDIRALAVRETREEDVGKIGIYLRLWVLCCVKSGTAVSMDELRAFSPRTPQSRLDKVVARLDEMNLIHVRPTGIGVDLARKATRWSIQARSRRPVDFSALPIARFNLPEEPVKTSRLQDPPRGGATSFPSLDRNNKESGARNIGFQSNPPRNSSRPRRDQKAPPSGGRASARRNADFFDENPIYGRKDRTSPIGEDGLMGEGREKPPDPRPHRSLWDRAFAAMGRWKYVRDIVGMAIKRYGPDLTLLGIRACEEQQPGDPFLYFLGSLKFQLLLRDGDDPGVDYYEEWCRSTAQTQEWADLTDAEVAA